VDGGLRKFGVQCFDGLFVLTGLSCQTGWIFVLVGFAAVIGGIEMAMYGHHGSRRDV